MITVPTHVKLYHKTFTSNKGILLVVSLLTICFTTMGQMPDPSFAFLRQIDSISKLNRRPLPAKYSGTRISPFSQNKPGSVALAKAPLSPSFNRPFTISSCNDTSSRFGIGRDSAHFYVHNSVRSRDGSLLMAGEYYNYYNTASQSQGLLIKSDLYGNVIWSKLYDSLNHKQYGWTFYYSILELKDGSILMAGAVYDSTSGNRDLLLTRTDANGDVLWTKQFYSKVWTQGSGSSDYFWVQQMAQDPGDGDVYLTGPSWAKGLNVMKLDIASGNMVWSSMYMLNANGYNNESSAGVVVKTNEIVAFGTQTAYKGNILVYRINKTNGDTIQTRMLELLDTPFTKLGMFWPDRVHTLLNGDYVITGRLFGYYKYLYNGTDPLYQAGVVILDSNLNFRKGYNFKNNIEGNLYNTKMTIHPDGSGLFSMLNVRSGYSGETFYTQFKDGAILKQRRRPFVNEGYPIENYSVQFDNNADMLIQLVGDSITNVSKIVFTKLHLTDTSSVCLGRETNITSVEPSRYGYQGYGYLDSLKTGVFLQRRVVDIQAKNDAPDAPVPFCEQYSVCDTLKLFTNVDTTCPQIPVTIRMYKNPSCGAMVLFNYDTLAVQSFTWMNDSTYQVVFRSAWRGYIKGSLPGCTVYTDSVLLTVLAAPAILQLGPDTTICPGNQVILNARSGYAAYRWQDGSTDSLFAVSKPGTYYVATVTACGDSFNDTIRVLPHQPAAVSLGSDITICNKDTVGITAPAGFISYQWTPPYNIDQTTGSSVNVSPSTDTAYIIKAEETRGCFTYDTIRVMVQQFPVIRLGADTSFCSGGNIQMDAGGGFQRYQWNTGATTPQLSANTAGTYIVTAVTAGGCKSSDTLNIVQVYPRPVVNLGNNSILCKGSRRVLDAGAFTRYIWNTGDNSRQLIINDTAFYTVQVTDSNQCTATGSLHISTAINSPAGFLPADTSICSYGELILAANQSFSAYLWNNGATANTITITQPGLYRLRATDQYGCTGNDSVMVTGKQCLKGLYVPSAFSPNLDGKNDVFKPMIFGNVALFEWKIFNRYGQIIFTSNDPLRGWDGTVKGSPQNAASFIWSCRFRFAGEAEQSKTGSVILLR